MTSPYVVQPKRWQLPVFFILAFTISWLIWVPQAAAALGLVGPRITPASPLNLVAVWGPGLAALLVLALTDGWSSIRAVLSLLGIWRVGPQWYIFALLFPASLWLVSRALDTLLGRSYQLTSLLTSVGPDYAVMLPVFLIFSLPNALGEEIGWRGFALPHLQATQSALGASLVLGGLWSLWHVPTWIAQGQTGNIPLLALWIISAAILFTWLYNNTGGSLCLAWLYHTATTATSYLLPPIPTLTDDVLMWTVALLVIVLAGPAHLSRQRIRTTTSSAALR